MDAWTYGPMDPWTCSYSAACRQPIKSLMSFADWLLPLLLITPDDEHGRDPFETLNENTSALGTWHQASHEAPST
jgi:hypothetical protein